MTSTIQLNNQINFDSLITKYKQDNFKKVQTIHHEFLYSCFHPKDKDLVINLEKNIQPTSLKIYDLVNPNEEKEGSQVDQDSSKIIERKKSTKQISLEEDKVNTMNIFDSASKQIVNEDKTGEQEQQTNKDTVDANLVQAQNNEPENKKDTNKKEFRFTTEITYQLDESQLKSKDYKYAISVWKTNQGNQPLQVQEYCFNGKPYKNRFFISNDGKYIFLMFNQKPTNEGESCPLKKVVILNLEELSEVKTFTFNFDHDVYNASHISLINDAQVLYMRVDVHHYFVNTSTGKVIWTFDSKYGTTEKEKEKEEQGANEDGDEEEEQEDTSNQYGDEDRDDYWYCWALQTHDWNIKKICFDENYKQHIYVVAATRKHKSCHVFRVKFHTKLESFFKPENQLYQFEHEKFVNEYYTDIAYNQGVSQIAFIYCDGHALIIKNNRALNITTINHFENSYYAFFSKNTFLYKQIWLICQDQGELQRVYDLSNVENYYTFDNYNFYCNDSSLFDFGYVSKDEVAVIGESTNKTQVTITYLVKGQPTINNIQDFLCFVDMNQKFGDSWGKGNSENESIGFLTQGQGKIYLNTLNYDQYKQDSTFYLYKSDKYISRKDLKYGPIVKALVIKADRKEAPNGVDYLLVMQYRNSIQIRSFLPPYYSYSERQQLIAAPMIHVPSEDYDREDAIYYLTTDNTSIKLMRIFFKTTNKEQISQVYELKSNEIKIFRRHQNSIYIMDESSLLRKIDLDNKKPKLKCTNQFQLEISDSDTLDFNDFEQIEITEKTLYKEGQVYMYHKVDDFSKNYQYMQQQYYINCDTILQGPTKVDGMNKIMYVVKGLNYLDDSDSGEKEEVTNSDDKENDEENQGEDEANEEQSLIQPEKQEEKKVEAPKPLISLQSSANWGDDIMENEEGGIGDKYKIQQSAKTFSSQKGVKEQKLNDEQLYDEDSESSAYDKVYIVFAPYIESNETPFVYDKNKNTIKMSTFIDRQNSILVHLQVGSDNIFKIYSSNGSFIQDVTIEGVSSDDIGQYQFVQISDNMKYILFMKYDSSWYQEEFVVVTLKNTKGFYSLQVLKRQKALWARYWHYSTYFDEDGFIDNDMNIYQIEFDKEDKKTIRVWKNDHIIINKISESSQIYKSLPEDCEFEQENTKYVFLNSYLFIKVKENFFEYFTLTQQAEAYPQKINIQFDDGIEIKRILTTAVDSLVQFVIQDNTKQTTLILNWDMTKNIEYSMIEVPHDSITENSIIKGIKQKLNYIVDENSFYDLQYLVPFKLILNKEKEEVSDKSINEKKLSSDQNQYLGLKRKNVVYTSYTVLDLFYWSYMTASQNKRLDQWSLSDIHLTHFNPRFQQKTIFHQYALEKQFFQLVYDEVMKNEEVPDLKHLFLSIIYPNEKGQSAFSLAIKGQSPKCVNIMLEMLIELPNYRVSPFIRQYFKDLFSMGSPTFERYLDICTFKHLSLNNTISLPWTSDADEVFVDFQTSYLGIDFFQKLLNDKQYGKTPDKPKEFEIQAQPEQNNEPQVDVKEDGPASKDINQQPGQDTKTVDIKKINSVVPKYPKKKEQTIEELLLIDNENEKVDGNEEEQKRVELSILEFDWIFKGQDAKSFIQDLADTDNDNIFAVDTIKIIIRFLWQKFFYRILAFIFLPFISYMIFFLVYVTYVYEKKQDDYTHGQFNYRLHISFIVVNCLHIAFFSGLEVRQLFINKMEYLKSFWNLIDLTSVIMNITYIVIDLTNVDPLKVRNVGTACVLIMWMKLFYFLRLFQPTAAMIRMIVQVIKDMYTFAACLALAMIGFGNAFYIFAINLTPDIDPDDPNAPSGPFTGGNFLMALIYSFQTGLGNFMTDSYGYIWGYPWLWIVFLLNVILIQIVLLNLLIAIMGDTYGQVKELGEKSMLKEMCAMISENEFVLSRESVFRDSKYIIVARLEKATGNDSQTIEGQIRTLRNNFSQLLADAKAESRIMIEQVKDDMVANYRAIDQKFTEGQSKQNTQITQVLQEIRHLGKHLNVQYDQPEEAEQQQQEDQKAMGFFNQFKDKIDGAKDNTNELHSKVMAGMNSKLGSPEVSPFKKQ